MSLSKSVSPEKGGIFDVNLDESQEIKQEFYEDDDQQLYDLPKEKKKKKGKKDKKEKKARKDKFDESQEIR